MLYNMSTVHSVLRIANFTEVVNDNLLVYHFKIKR